jgi:hypothetical protein
VALIVVHNIIVVCVTYLPFLLVILASDFKYLGDFGALVPIQDALHRDFVNLSQTLLVICTRGLI